MAQSLSLPQLQTHKLRHRAWLKVLFVGVLMNVLYMGVLFATNNVHTIPTVILLGNFLIPVTFVTFFYERRQDSNVTFPALVGGFFWGGVLGTMMAALAEALLLRNTLSATTLPNTFIVGAIEELAKVLGVLVVAWRWSRDREQDGIILGAAAGMGFAALESSGYALDLFLAASNHVSQLTSAEIVLLGISVLRGLFAPFCHGVWTALLVSVMFREKGAHSFGGILKVIGAYLTVIVLHGLWDGVGSVGVLVPGSATVKIIATLLVWPIVAIVGLLLLRHRWRESMLQA